MAPLGNAVATEATFTPDPDVNAFAARTRFGYTHTAAPGRHSKARLRRLNRFAAKVGHLARSVFSLKGREVHHGNDATSAIPIVFGMGGDPVSDGLVESFNRPGGNVTGVTLMTNLMEPKRLSLLQEVVPGVKLVGALLNPNFPPAARQLQELEEAARTIGQRLFVSKASNDAELDVAFASLFQQQLGALLVAGDPYFDTRRDRIIAFAAQNRLPAIYQFREYAVAGGLLSYGVSLTEAYRQYGVYAARFSRAQNPQICRCSRS